MRRPTLLVGLTMEREALYERIDARVRARCSPPGVREEVRRAHAAGAVGDGAQGARLRGAARRRRGGDEAPHPQLRAAPAHVDAQARRRALDRRDRPRAGGGRAGDRDTPGSTREWRTGRGAGCTRSRAQARAPASVGTLDFPANCGADEIREVAGTRQRLPDRGARRAAVRADARAHPPAVRRPLRGVRRRGAAAVAQRRPTLRRRPAHLSTPTAPRPSCRATARARRSSISAATAGPRRTSSRSRRPQGRSRPTITGAEHLPRGHGASRHLTSTDYPSGAARRASAS